MKRDNLTIIFICSIIVLLSGCAKKSPIPAADISRLEAEHAIAVAQSEIDEAEEVGADVAEARNILNNARKLLEADNYTKAKNEADRAGSIALGLKQEILAKIRNKEDAASAIERAEKLIDEARNLGADISEPEQILSKAETEFESKNYRRAVELADTSAEIAQEIIYLLKGEKYIVGTWEADRACLWNIARKKKIYNDPWKWKKIYKANSNRIKDPNLIFPNQILIIPKD